MSKIEEAYKKMKEMQAMYAEAVAQGKNPVDLKKIEKKYEILQDIWNRTARQGRLKLTKIKQPEGNLLIFCLKNKKLGIEVRCGCCGKVISKNDYVQVGFDVIHNDCKTDYFELLEEIKIKEVNKAFRAARDHNNCEKCSICHVTTHTVKSGKYWYCYLCHPDIPKYDKLCAKHGKEYVERCEFCEEPGYIEEMHEFRSEHYACMKCARERDLIDDENDDEESKEEEE